MRRDQKGYTIAELLVAVAILSIVVASVCGFIIVGSRSYAAGNSDINVQQEAQLALNQMSDVLIDTTRSVNYAAYDAVGTPESALKDAEFSFTPEDKSLIMFNGVVVKDPSGGSDTIEDGNGNKHYHFYWSKAKETLFYAEQELDDPLCVESADILAKFPDVTNADPDADPETTKWYVLAQHVTDFSADLSQLEEKRVVQLALTFMDGTKEYVTSNNVTIRNKVGVNDAELAPLNRKVEIDINVKSSVVLEPGETFVLPTPKVSGKNVTDKSVTWSLVDPDPSDPAKTPNGTTLTADGILTLSIDEEGTFKVRATTNAEDSDHNQSSADVTVKVKRVKDITLWKSHDTDPGNGPNEISPGCTFTVSAKVIGDYLGETCDACGDDTSIDKHVLSTKSPILGTDEHVWRVWDPHLHASAEEIAKNGWEDWHPSQHVINQDQDEYSATFYVTPDTSDAGDHGYVIQVMSLLSYYRPYGSPTYKGRRYNWVWPSISFNVVKSKSNIHAGGSLHWGASTEISWDDLSPYHYYVVCARVREYGTTGGDKIMMYLTEGNTTRVTPDMFGVEDVSKPWSLSLQVLNPGKQIPPGVGLSSSIRDDVAKQVNDPTVLDIINDYLHNCDASGTYVGTKYLHSDKLDAMINPPEIYYEYDGQKNLEGELKLKTVSTLGGPAWTEFRVDYVKNTRDETLGYWFANNNVKFSMYKEKSDGTLEKIYWYNSGGNYYEGDSNPYGGALQLSEIQSASGVKIKLGSDRLSEAAGNYRLIPTIIYEQGSWADHVGGVSVYYVNYDPNYKKKQCYEDRRSTVYYELVDGGNVDAFWSYHNNEFTKGEINFPAPSESGFTDYFDRENLNWQNAKKLDWFVKSINGRNNTTYYVPSSMRCRYVADRKVYELELFYNYHDSTWNRSVEISAGVFQCAANGNRWERKDRGTYDSLLEQNKKPQVDGSTADMNLWIWGNYYKGKMYIPLPSENAFIGHGWNELGFERKKSGWQEKADFALLYQRDGEQGTQYMWNIKLSCYYDASTDGYLIQLRDSNGGWIGQFACDSNGNRWTQK